MQITLEQIPSAVEVRVGLPRPNWQVITDWVTGNVGTNDYDTAWTAIATDWLDLLIGALPGEYHRDESENFYLLSTADARTAKYMLNQCEYARVTILESLAGVAHDEGHGPHVVLAFSKLDAYYDYVADVYPDEGEFGASSGMHINQGYGHIVVPMTTLDSWERTIGHELNHALLGHLPLPTWLDEGVTLVTEDRIAGSSLFHMDRELRERHRAYWNRETISAFWSGDSFYRADEGQELSYHLAQVLVLNLMADHRRSFLQFLGEADRADAGQSAIEQACRTTLGKRVEQFLGCGDWEPGEKNNG